MKVWIVSLEWNTPPSEVTGDTGIVGVYAEEADAQLAGSAERARLHREGQNVYQYSQAAGAWCSGCGQETPRTPLGEPLACPNEADHDVADWCQYCGAECTDSGDCNNDHDEWDIDVHVTEHEVHGVPRGTGGSGG